METLCRGSSINCYEIMQGNQWDVKLNSFSVHSLLSALMEKLLDSLAVTNLVLNKEMSATVTNKLH